MTAPAFELSELAYQAPLLVLALGGILVLLIDAFARDTTEANAGRRWLMWIAVGVCVAALGATRLVHHQLWGSSGHPLFGGMLISDRYATLTTMVLIVGAMLTLIISPDYLNEHATEYGEYYALVLFATAGMVLLVMAGDLVTVFLGVETMSLAVYILTGAFRRSKRAAEAAMKYYLTGAFATAFLLYGIALVYGAAGTTNLAAIGARAEELAGRPVFVTGELLLIIAFGFKLAAVPFHMWAPDAYEGAPTPVTAFMAAGVKAAGVAAVLRVFVTAFGGSVLPYGRSGWASILAVLAAATMTLGNVMALRQDNVKRLLAYSSIAHAGYLLVGVVAAGVGEGAIARPALLFYLAAYTFTTVGAFAIVASLGRQGDERLLVDDWAGLASRYPGRALAMTIFLLSLGGFPPTGGFFGKFYVFRAAMQAFDGQLLWLVVVAVLNSVVSVFYYLRVVMAMYFREPARETQALASPRAMFVVVASALAILAMGLTPSPFLERAVTAAMRGI